MEDNIFNSENEKPQIVSEISYKMIALRGLVVFPGQTIHFDLGRDKSVLALNKAVEEGEDIFLVTQKHMSTSNPAPKDIYRIGTLSKIKQVLKMPNDTVRVLAVGKERKQISSYTSISPYFEVSLKDFEKVESEEINQQAIMRRIEEELEKYRKLDARNAQEIGSAIGLKEPSFMVGFVGGTLMKNDAEKQKLLSLNDEYEQLEMVLEFLVRESEILMVEKKISTKVRQNIDKNQKEYYIREQIKALHDELGDGEDEANEYRTKADKKKLPKIVKEKINKELARMQKMSPTSPEVGVIRTYIETLLDLPWTEKTKDNINLIQAREILDNDHYGLDKVKDRIIEYLAVHQLTKALNGPILCFVGPPGVGKTSIVASIARASNRKLVTMSLGGVRDEAEIRGHRRTYIGALPGRLVSGMKQAEVINPVFLLDEIDKMSSDFRGDPSSAMLEVLDPNQNFQFKDHYVEMPYDLSKVMFVTTANTLETIPTPLLDRMEVIELSGYTYEEKLEIAKKYLLPKQIKANGLKEENIKIDDKVMLSIVSNYTRESGVRNLEREIGTVCRKIAVKIVNGSNKDEVFDVSKKDLIDYLGVVKYKDLEHNADHEIGLATGLAWTSVGGVVLNIEVAIIPDGKGEITLTGSLGDVMKESCRTAMSLVKAKAKEFGIDAKRFSETDIHIHLPEGATPKDGPSAGITMATAILSAYSGKKIDKNIAMTGEVTLRGKVLAIGGLKEKSLAAFRHGIKKIIIPTENEKDVAELPKEVTQNLEIILADNIDTVFKNALL